MTSVWPFRPLLGATETLDYLSEVNSSYVGEQRLALRSAPRQNFSYEFKIISNYQLAVANALAKQNTGSEIYVPVWPEETRLSGTYSSSLSGISFDTRYADYRVGSFALLYQNIDKYSVLEIATKSDSALTFNSILGNSFINPSIMPLRTAWQTEGYTADRQATSTDYSAQFLVRDNINLAANYVSPYPQFNSLDVVIDRPVLLEPAGASIVRAANYIDSGLGLVELEPMKNYSDFGQTVNFYSTRGESLWKRRLWIHSLYGKQKTFYLPTFNYDLQLQSPIGSGDTIITVKSIALSAYYLNKSIMIWLKSGTRYFRAIAGASDAGGNSLITMASSLGAAVAVADVLMISFINLNRLDSDQIQINHKLLTGATISILTTEVPA